MIYHIMVYCSIVNLYTSHLVQGKNIRTIWEIKIHAT